MNGNSWGIAFNLHYAVSSAAFGIAENQRIE